MLAHPPTAAESPCCFTVKLCCWYVVVVSQHIWKYANKCCMFFLWLVSLLRTAGKYLWWCTEEQRRIGDNRAQERRTGFNGAERKEVCLCVLTTTVTPALSLIHRNEIKGRNMETMFFFPLLFLMCTWDRRLFVCIHEGHLLVLTCYFFLKQAKMVWNKCTFFFPNVNQVVPRIFLNQW